MPERFVDGKQIYAITLKIINKSSPQFARFIHATPKYNPFSTALPDIVNILNPALEVIFKQMSGVEIIDERDRRDAGVNMDEWVNLHFERTLFRVAQVSYPLPDPWKIIKSWKTRWNSLFADKISLALPIEGVRTERVELKYVNITSCKINIADYRPYTAFSGNVCLRWLGGEKELRELWLLARFAEFAGTGAKTPMGCGVTKVVKM